MMQCIKVCSVVHLWLDIVITVVTVIIVIDRRTNLRIGYPGLATSTCHPHVVSVLLALVCLTLVGVQKM